MKYKLLLAAFPLAALLTQCHSTKSTTNTAASTATPTVDAGPAAKPSVLYVPTAANASGTVTVEELAEGRRLVEIKCTNCHKLYPATRYEADRWVSVVKNMQRRAETTDEKISDSDVAFIVKYYSAPNTSN